MGWMGLPPLREYWRQINRQENEAKAQQRAKRKAKDKRRAKCRCEAYPWPHRPGGGLCRYPDPPAARWKDIKAAEIAERVAKFRTKYGEPSPEMMADLTHNGRPNSKRYVG